MNHRSKHNPKRVVSLRDYYLNMLEDHPFEISLSVALILFGIQAFLRGLRSVPGVVQTLPFYLALAYCILAVLGGASVLLGKIFRPKHEWAYGLEGFGMYVSASAWGAYILGLLFSPITGKSTLSILALLALTSGCLLRARGIERRAKTILEILRQARQSQEASNE